MFQQRRALVWVASATACGDIGERRRWQGRFGPTMVWPFPSPVTSSVSQWVPSPHAEVAGGSAKGHWWERELPGDVIWGSLFLKSIKGGFLSAFQLHIVFSCGEERRALVPGLAVAHSQGVQHPGTLWAGRTQASVFVPRCKSSC